MLNRELIVKELGARSAILFNTLSFEREYARQIWSRIADDSEFFEATREYAHRYSIPSWQGRLGQTTTLKSCSEYEIIAVDGSQIYPDRHQGIDCFLINIGAIHVRYGCMQSEVCLESEPFVFVGSDAVVTDYQPEIVNAKRTQLEFEHGLAWMSTRLSKAIPALFLFDGSLIFWHLQLPQTEQECAFVQKYMNLLDGFFEQRAFLAGYISLPKGRELVSLVAIGAALDGTDHEFSHLVDSDIAQFYVQPGQRSLIFKNHAPIADLYPVHSKPHFFYLNTGEEIARVEIPAWIAQDAHAVDLVASCIYDQALKGHGYPVTLAEAHEAAVVTHADRDFFYFALQQLTLSQGHIYRSSQKSDKKRRMNV